jgi:uncharacterized protein (UPF0332 family)
MSKRPVPIDPQHLLEQADKLVGSASQGRPRGADLRRAISASYYALFHFTTAAAADSVVPVSKRSAPQYTRIYRGIDHRSLRELCKAISGTTLPAKYDAHAPPTGFGRNIYDFATAVVDLQEKRHLADYDPQFRVTKSDALLTISTARAALARFDSASASEKEAFLSLLLFPPRQ